MFSSLDSDLSALLAELALRELTQAGFGDDDATGRSEAAIVSEALGAPAVVLAHVDGEPDMLRVAAQAGWNAAPARIPVKGLLADALERSSCVELRPVPEALAEVGVGGGLVVRIGSEHRPYALLGVLTEAPRVFSAQAWTFLRAAAGALHARFALDDTRHALEESRARALSVFETTVDGVITIDTRGRIESFNAGAERIFGYTPEEVIGLNVSVLMPEPYHSEHDGYLANYRESGVRRIIGIGREVVGRRRSGSTFPMELAVSEVRLPSGDTIFTGLVRDISERRVLEREVLRIADGERRRIGQDLHDGLGQQLTAVGLFLRGLARGLETDGSEHAAEAHRLVAEIDQADEQARGLARSLVPVELERNGLEAALERLAERAERLHGVTVTAETTGSGPAEATALTADAATNLFWIAQEAVSNAAQHGRASVVSVRLVRGADQLRLRIEDDGVGFGGHASPSGVAGRPLLSDDASDGDVHSRVEVHSHVQPSPDGHRGIPGPIADGHADGPINVADDGRAGGAVQSVSVPARPDDQRGMGLRIMHYRAHLAGGSIEIRPRAEGGTVVTCTVPLLGPGFLSA